MRRDRDPRISPALDAPDASAPRATAGCARAAMLGLALAAVAAPAPLYAGTFDSAGRLHLDAAVAGSLDGPAGLPEGWSLSLYDVDQGLLAPSWWPDPAGLEGVGGLEFGGRAVYGLLALNATPAAAGRRVELHLWQRPLGTRASASLYWSVGDGDSDLSLGVISLRPTGRVTSDGWEEWSSGPFDFLAGGLHGPRWLVLTDAQYQAYFVSYSSLDPALRVVLDGLELLDLGPAAVPPAPCTALDEATSCGPLGACLFGRCADSALVNGPPPLDAQRRADYLARRLFEYRHFEGGRLPQARLDGLSATLTALAAPELADPARFWPRFSAAVADLRDGHASAPLAAYPADLRPDVCLHLGQADLLPGAPLRPLVFSTSGLGALAAGLLVGDALVAIDGLEPAQWARQSGRITHPGDPAGFDLVTAPDLLAAALRGGSRLGFARCGGPLACAEPAVERVELDTVTLAGADIWQGRPPAWLQQRQRCDYRFGRDVDDPQVTRYQFAGWADRDGVRTLLINGVPSLWGEAGQARQQAVLEALTDGASLLILDQRSGSGGSIEAVDLLLTQLVAQDDFYAMDLYPWLEDRPLDADLMAGLAGCAGDSWGCANSLRWVLGQAHEPAGPPYAAGRARLAVLNGMDVSGNDYTSRLVTYRSAPTRIFGGGATWGAFGVIWGLPAHDEELYGGSFQVHDTVFRASAADGSTDFATGTGVLPDEVVYQRQSDALAGVDSVIEAARAWLLGG